LWFLDQLEPNSPVYNVSQVLRIDGPLNVRALERSLNEIVKRHEVLRTTFISETGHPLQAIAPTLDVTLPVVDLQEMPDHEREIEAERLVAEEIGRPFDLSLGPLIRTKLVRLDEEHHILILVMHHIISDEWSLGVLFRELSGLYEVFCSGRQVRLPELPIQYVDYAAWQREQAESGAFEGQLTYWKQRLAGALPSLDLPVDRPRRKSKTDRGAYKTLVGPRALVGAFQALCIEEAVTTFMGLLAAFVVLLYRYTGQDDILVGTPIANRDRVELEGLIGFFLNTLVLRADLSGVPTFRELLGRVRGVCLDAYTHQDLPFEKLVEELRPARDLSHSPLFQVMFVHTPARPLLELAGVTASRQPSHNGTAKFALTLFVNLDPEGLVASLEYSTDLFDEDTILRMLNHYQTLLASIVADPDQPIGKLPILPDAERNQLLVEWNDNRVAYPKELLVHQLFEAQAERVPDATAVEFEHHSLTYRELNERANPLAHYLKGKRVGPDVLVGICLERSLEMVVSVLAILKAGGACVPLDPTYPNERLAFMIGDADVPVLLTQERLKGTFPKYKGHLVLLDTQWATIAEASRENPDSHALGDHLIYVLYTSGSTGRPKGVALPHRSLGNLITWQLRNTTLPGPTRMLQFSPLSFDASFTDTFMTLCAGGTLVIAPELLRRDPADLLRFIADRKCERLNLPAVVLEQLARTYSARKAPNLYVKEVISTAEQLRVTRSVRELFAQMPNCTLQNQYGPTESHVVTALTLKGPSSEWPTLPPVGRPISNTQTYILDDLLQPVPIGVVGTLYVGGVCLARGYLNRPDLTRDGFIPDPFSTDPGARLYATGDLARHLADGNIELLGRADDQVKIRGYRVEPGEVEAVLGRHPSVRQVSVVARVDKSNGPSAAASADRRLVAYIVPHEGLTPSTTELRGFAKDKLPEYMVPSVYVMLDAFPLTPSGKVDRRALPSVDRVRPELEEVFVAPRTPVEVTLAAIWSEVLDVEPLGVHDDFFELGGHSLLATQVVSRIRDALRIELPLRRIFEAPTIALLATLIGGLAAAEEGVPSRIQPLTRDTGRA
jgi:amino acid adenylation domain-containing protein